ncbi:uncharacterized protein LOC126833293 [Adelges cooleyi]|uniref:uncharacterized protein LOC126833293 n=1 Tax=Adelges cooleyi TaxID=133065 RepID=UPI00217FCBD2|nr:uncharacterized protein LOC126833293 [Adelges cooleyi]XP_050420500.1 uncharacterized protein LOC126833293 [Adelges cooleyi]
MVKISLPWLLLVVLKLASREIKSDEIVTLQEVYDLCQGDTNAEICDFLGKSPNFLDIDRMEMPDKRKQKTVFSSWGGKRQNNFPYLGKRPAFSSWGGKRSSDKKNSRPKQTFSSWGGKRSMDMDTYNMDTTDHQMEKRDLNGFRPEDKTNYRNKVTKGIHALFTMFSDWSKEPEEKKGSRYTRVNGLRTGSDFFSWGGKRANGNTE